MTISTPQLKILAITATILGIYGLGVFTQTNSLILLLAAIADLALAGFFWYKYRLKNRRLTSKKHK